MKIIFYLALMLSSFLTKISAQEQKTIHLETEVDPIAFVLNGYSFHAIVSSHKIRFDLGFFGVEQPENYSKNKGFSVRSIGEGLKIQYLLNSKKTWFIGIGLGYLHNKIIQDKTQEQLFQNLISMGFNTGYRWFPFKNNNNFLKKTYVSPWLGLDYNLPQNEVTFLDANYSQKKWAVFPTIHLGYKF